MQINREKFFFVNQSKILFIFIAVIVILSILGQVIAFGSFNLPVQKHIAKLFFGILIMIGIASVNLKLWENFSYIIYFILFGFLLLVELMGVVKLGAQRWIDLYVFTFQPSEMMKLVLILAISRYYASLSVEELKLLKFHFPPLIMTFVPAILVLKQPDLGTAILLIGIGVGMSFLAGFPFRAFCSAIIVFFCLCPVGWYFLHDYQRNRILNFLDPERDPLGTGYHILQSKIAIGSGYIFGKGIFKGTQSTLNFLPEKHTDFIFTTLAEEVGFAGSLLIIMLFAGLIYYFFWVGSESKNKFARHVCNGLALLLFLHVFINIGMVMGVVPVVGIPLPFLSYGGSSLVTFMISLGLIISALLRIYHKY